jgi:GH24 family phage-related lysozyme (muramidase)
VNDEAKKRNQNLPGQGGVFNYVNLHAYHYAGNNPVKLVDPDGREGEDNQQKNISERGIQFIKSFEEFRATIYDANPGKGDWTIGFGHQLTKDEIASGIYKNGITLEKAEELFNQDVQFHVNGVNKEVNNSKSLTQNQFDALVSASFNMGRSRFLKSEIVKTVESFGASVSASDTINTNKFKIKIADSFQDTIPAPPDPTNRGIKNRRYNEYKIFVNDDYTRSATPAHLYPWSKGTLP